MSLPLLKVVTLLVKQAAKPVARGLAERAKENPVLQAYMISGAHFVHRSHYKMEAALMNSRLFRDISNRSAPPGRLPYIPLTEDEAAAAGAEMAGETTVFGIAVVGVIVGERVSVIPTRTTDAGVGALVCAAVCAGCLC